MFLPALESGGQVLRCNIVIEQDLTFFFSMKIAAKKHRKEIKNVKR